MLKTRSLNIDPNFPIAGLMVTASPVSNSSAAIGKQRTTFGGIVGRRHGMFTPLKHVMVVMKRLDKQRWICQLGQFIYSLLEGGGSFQR